MTPYPDKVFSMSEGTQYQIIDRIDVGGMAEIFRAKNLETGEIVAIKRILPALGQQAEFVDMFVDEAAICMFLKHKNIVRVYQLGMMGDDLFLSMEYVAGINLRDLLNFSSRYEYQLPVSEAVLIAIQILDGLDYAHNCCDDEGVPLNIIHRDVSPPNILLGYNGDVKITDFGLVKAKNQMTRTVPGLIKGKFSYLSPEAAYGESIDLRSDIYAVGIILWEMLTSHPLYSDPVEMKILDLVRRSIVPEIAQYNPNVPPELEAIVRKGLSRTRAGRYQTAKAFADDLRAFYNTIGRPKSTLGQIVTSIRPPKENDEVAKAGAQLSALGPTSVSSLIPLPQLEAALKEGKSAKAAEAKKAAQHQETATPTQEVEEEEEFLIDLHDMQFMMEDEVPQESKAPKNTTETEKASSHKEKDAVETAQNTSLHKEKAETHVAPKESSHKEKSEARQENEDNRPFYIAMIILIILVIGLLFALFAFIKG